MSRRAVYAEAHCFAVLLGAWVDAMVIPLPDEPLALIEFMHSSPQGGFWVRVVRFEDLPARGSRIRSPRSLPRHTTRSNRGLPELAQVRGAGLHRGFWLLKSYRQIVKYGNEGVRK